MIGAPKRWWQQWSTPIKMMVKELSGMLVTGNQMVGHLAIVSIESEGDGENLMVCGLRKVWW